MNSHLCLQIVCRTSCYKLAVTQPQLDVYASNRQRVCSSLLVRPSCVFPVLQVRSVCLRKLAAPARVAHQCHDYLRMTSSKSNSPELVSPAELKGGEGSSGSQNGSPSRAQQKRSIDEGTCSLQQDCGMDESRKKSKGTSSPELIDISADDKQDSDTGSSDVEIIDVVPDPRGCQFVNPTKGLYHPRSPLCRRQWRNTNLGNHVWFNGSPANSLAFSVLSYNVLAQELLVQHGYLYQQQHPDSLEWSRRHAGLMRELSMHRPDVICLQEVQADHVQEFFKTPLSHIGYDGIYKQRTGDKIDGCAIFWQRGKFRLLEETTVEFYQPGVQLLNRDNIAIVARLGVLGAGDELVVATTHLLYNPKRSDVRLVQVQLLLAELDRLSHTGASRLPVVLTGDFNLKPHSEVYRLLAHGELPYENAVFRTDPTLPPFLGVTDCCRHSAVVAQREETRYTSRTSEVVLRELSLLQLYHSERPPQAEPQRPRPSPEHKFGSGTLLHGLQLCSAYEHPQDKPVPRQDATTHQDAWVTVDYIFYSDQGEHPPESESSERRRLRLLSRWSLPTVSDCHRLGAIPNFDAPSDHFPLVACFLLSQ